MKEVFLARRDKIDAYFTEGMDRVGMATATQGAKADTAVQPGDLGSWVLSDDPDFPAAKGDNPELVEWSRRLATTHWAQSLINHVGSVSVTGVSSSVSLSDEDAVSRVILITGTLSDDVAVEFPQRDGVWMVRNATSGNHTLTLKIADQASTPVTLPRGRSTTVYGTATYLHEVAGDRVSKDSPAFQGAPTAPTAAQGERGTTLANTAFAYRVAQGYSSVTISDGVNTLTEAQVGVKTLALVGSPTSTAIVELPAVAGDWVVRNVTGQIVAVRASGQESGYVNVPPSSLRQVVSNTATVYEVATSALAEGGYRGEFVYGEDYDAGETFAHGSGVYRVTADMVSAGAPDKSSKVVKVRHNDYAGPERALDIVSTTLTVVASNKSPAMMSKDGSKVWALNGTYLWESQDDGATWEYIELFSGTPIDAIRELGNGELLVVINNLDTSRRDIRVSSGYSADPSTMTWETKVSTVAPRVNFTSAWSLSVVGNVVLAAEYGPKAGEMWGGAVAEPGENARYVYLSTDNGKSFRTVFDLNSHAVTDGVHVHGVAYDPWWNRIWVTYGDKTNATMYSDDLGGSWSFAHHGTEAGSPHQNVGIIAMPTCVLFGTDVAPNGIQRIDRAHGKHTADGTYPIDIAHALNEHDTTRTHLCHGIFQARGVPDAPVLFGFGSESNPAPSVVVSTYDGWTFQEIWRDTLDQPAGLGLRHVFGPTMRGNIIALSNDQRNEDAGEWTQVTLRT